MFSFIAAEKGSYPVAVMCRVLKVSRTGFHHWERRAPSDRALTDAWLTDKIKRVREGSRGVYGAPRLHAELRLEHGIRVGHKRVARLMKAAGIAGIRPRKRWRTTIRLAGVRPAEDLVGRQFRPAAPNLLWVADITYLRSSEGWLYLAAVQDAYSRAIVGWAMATHMKTSLVADALQMALARRRPQPGVIHHSDQDSQLGFNRSSQRLDERSCDGSTATEVGSSRSSSDALAGSSIGGASRGAPAVLGRDRSWCVQRGRGRRGWSVGSGWCPVVSRGWRDAHCHPGPAVGALLGTC